jgi:predicted DNA-binding WGR domain protein
LGSGLQSFWILRAGAVTLTLGMTGFTASDWSRAVSFDLLLPRADTASRALETVLRKLANVWVLPAKDVATTTGLAGPALAEALQTGCQQGKLMYDLAADSYRLRALTEAPIDLNRLEFRNDRERSARDLVTSHNAVQIVSENRIAGTGVEVTARVAVAQDRRDYRPVLLLNEEGALAKAECTCAFFRKQGLKAGPCVHLIALRMAYAERQAEQGRGVDEKTVVAETRTFSKRDTAGEDVYQVTLDRTRLKVRWGRAGQPMRSQVLRFNTADDARSAYFARVGDFGARGFLDVTAG